jgi:FixJ family two-component response regulator
VEKILAMPATILIAVSDGVMADSLRFSLELEGLEVKLCDEYSLRRAGQDGLVGNCLILDQTVFARVENDLRALAGADLPVILLIGHETGRLVARARAAGVTMVVDTPIMGAALVDAVASSLKARVPHRFG